MKVDDIKKQLENRVPINNEVAAYNKSVLSKKTVWTIALENKAKSATVYQYIDGLLQLNPEAFNKGNLNLRNSSIELKLPTDTFVNNIDKIASLIRYTNSKK